MIRLLLFVLVGLVLSCEGTGDERSPPAADEHAGHGATGAGSQLPEPVLEALRQAMVATDQIRVLLASDRLDGIAAAAEAALGHLQHASGTLGDGQQDLQATIAVGVQAARTLSDAPDLETARRQFGALSEVLFTLAATDPRLQEGWEVFRCPMAGNFPKWFQREGQMENPYMGQAMLTCGTTDGWGEAAVAATPVNPDEVAYWTCPMHPSVRSEDPGQCPICGMDLTPVTEGSLESGEVIVDSIRRQELGIRTAPVARGTLSSAVRATGIVEMDESAITSVTTRVDGFIERLYADEPGAQVKKGEPLFAFYSPELYATQQDLIRLSKATDLQGAELLEATKQRLILWGLSPGQVQRILEKGEPLRQVPILSPASGFIVEKMVVEGAMVDPGMALFEIASLETVWVEARVFEGNLARVAEGQAARVTIPERPGLELEGKVDTLLPMLDEELRAGRVRVELDNPGLVLRPGMYVQVSLSAAAEDSLVIPREAVIYAGDRRVVFVERGADRLIPVEVSLGRRDAETVEVLSGLEEGDTVVVSGNFLIAAESRLRAASGFWGEVGQNTAPAKTGGDHAGH